MTTSIIGREEEIEIIDKLLNSAQSELLALYGRRRVGKTFLIKTYCKEHLAFSCSGQYLGKTPEQLINFTTQLNTYFPGKKIKETPANWQEAFTLLKDRINSIKHRRKKVIFFDELPWLDSHKSGFLSSFSYFWNMYVEERNDLLVVICGSAASWIIEKVVNNKGGLHNRITQRIRLLPFTLQETERYLQHRSIRLERYQLLQLYMAMGGIPLYLNAVERGKTAAQNIEKICFSKDGLLANEFNNLYAALFNTPEKHVQVIKALAQKNKGLTRSELLKTGKLLTGGGITTVLSELTESGFIEKVYPFENLEKNALYRLTDEFSLFYLKFMQHKKAGGKEQWMSLQRMQTYTSWCGYAFENTCFKHIFQIKKALEVAGVQSSEYSWYKAGSAKEEGAQIDLLIDRADQCINICEMKFSTKPYVIDKKYAAELQKKVQTFHRQTNTRKMLVLTLVTTYGVKDNDHKQELVDNEITMDAFFEP
jgi:AAA+ ATPase superfamily predicted ATPase